MKTLLKAHFEFSNSTCFLFSCFYSMVFVVFIFNKSYVEQYFGGIIIPGFPSFRENNFCQNVLIISNL